MSRKKAGYAGAAPQRAHADAPPIVSSGAPHSSQDSGAGAVDELSDQLGADTPPEVGTDRSTGRSPRLPAR